MFFINESIDSTTVSDGVQRKIIATSGPLMTVEIKFKKGAIGAMHSHPHEQVSYILSGSFEYEINFKRKILKTGDSC